MTNPLLRRAALFLLAAACCVPFCAGAAPAPKNIAPTVTLTSPVAGAPYTAPATVQLSANAADADGTIAKVEFFRGTTLIASVAAAPYTATWSNVAAGSYSVTAKATDNKGATTTSGAVTVTVASAATATTITSPAANSTNESGLVDVAGTFNGTAETTIVVKNAANNTYFAKITGANTWLAQSVPLLQGLNTITVTAVRRDGTSSSASVTVDFPQRLVVLMSPKKGAVYELPPSLTFQAATALSSGTVQRVDYYRTYVGKLGSATTPPYTFTLNNPPKGDYSVFATLVDDKGVSRQSTEVFFQVVGPNLPPTVSLTAPANNAVFGAPASFTLQATAADSDGSVNRVEFLRDGQLIGASNSPPYSLGVAGLAAGSYTFAARAVDDKDAATTSSPVTVQVYAPPSVTLATSVPSGKVAAGGSVTLNATATSNSVNPIARVEFYAGGVLVGTATGAPWSVTWANIPLGDYAMTAKAIDSAGLSSTSAPVGLSAVPGPLVNVTSPAGGATYFTPASIAIAANAAPSAAALTGVAFYADGNLLGTSNAAPYTFTWSGAAAGNHAITAVATDALGITSTSPVVNVTVVAPTVVIDSPVAGASVSSEGVIVRGHINAPKYSGVVVNGQLAAVDVDGTFYAADVRPKPGTNSIDVLLSTPDEVQVAASVVVTPFTPVAPTTTLSIGDVEGLNSLKAKWQVETSRGIRDITVDYWGDGSSVFKMSDTAGYVPGSTSTTLTVPYPAAGVIRPIITVEDMQGGILQKQFVLDVRSVGELDTHLRWVWGRMVDKLKAGDVAGALTAVTPPARDRFQEVFQNLQPDPATALGNLGSLTGVQYDVESAEFVLLRESVDGNTAFPVYFIRCSDGVWRVNAM